MRHVHALMAVVALSIITLPVVAYADGDEQEEHEGGGWEHRDWSEAQEERREEWREEQREAWRPWYGGYGYYSPQYGYSDVQPYGYGPRNYGSTQHCRWVTQQYYDADGYLVSRRIRSCW